MDADYLINRNAILVIDHRKSSEADTGTGPDKPDSRSPGF